jgi:hypothetical protein
MTKICGPGETLEQALNRRIVESAGVISTSDSSVSARLIFKEADAGPVPPRIREEIRKVHMESVRPDGEELVEALEVAQTAMQVACGFFYRWRFPRGESEDLIAEWRDKRKDWHRELRTELKGRRADGLDSPGLLRNAAERAWGVGKMAGSEGAKWRSRTFRAWAEIENKVQPEPDVVWLDEYLAKAAAQWALEAPGIVWYLFSAFGRRVEQLTKLPRFGGGDNASAAIRQERGDRSIIASVKAHGTGKNLQSFWRSLVANQFSGAFEKAEEYASYIQSVSGNPQKLLYGEKTWT